MLVKLLRAALIFLIVCGSARAQTATGPTPLGLTFTNGANAYAGINLVTVSGGSLSLVGPGNVQLTISGGGTGCTPSGSNNQVLYIAGSGCAGSANMTFNPSTNQLSIANPAVDPGGATNALNITGTVTNQVTEANLLYSVMTINVTQAGVTAEVEGIRSDLFANTHGNTWGTAVISAGLYGFGIMDDTNAANTGVVHGLVGVAGGVANEGFGVMDAGYAFWAHLPFGTAGGITTRYAFYDNGCGTGFVTNCIGASFQGNVGVGTSTNFPQAAFHAYGTASGTTFAGLQIQNTSNTTLSTADIRFLVGSANVVATPNGYISHRDVAGAFQMAFGVDAASGTTVMMITRATGLQPRLLVGWADTPDTTYYTLDIKGTGLFSGLLSTAATATAGAGFNLAPGTAPTSPNNGDLWTTSAGLYVQINGGTVGPLGAGGGGVSSVVNSDSSLTISPTTGNVIASLNVANANAWTALQSITTTITQPAVGSYGSVFAQTSTLTGNSANDGLAAHQAVLNVNQAGFNQTAALGAHNGGISGIGVATGATGTITSLSGGVFRAYNSGNGTLTNAIDVVLGGTVGTSSTTTVHYGIYDSGTCDATTCVGAVFANNVGIGVTTSLPQAGLHIYGIAAAASYRALEIQNAGTGAGTSAYIAFLVQSGAVTTTPQAYISGRVVSGVDQLVFGVDGADPGFEVMVLTRPTGSSWGVSIGKGATAATTGLTLDVNGVISGTQIDISGTQIAASNLSNGTVGSGAVVLATAAATGFSCAVPLTTGVGAGTLTCFFKATRAFTVDNIIATVVGTLVTVTPSVFECGTSTTCATPTTIGSGAVTTANTATPITVASAAVASGDYVAVELTAGTITSVAVNVQVAMH